MRSAKPSSSDAVQYEMLKVVAVRLVGGMVQAYHQDPPPLQPKNLCSAS